MPVRGVRQLPVLVGLRQSFDYPFGYRLGLITVICWWISRPITTRPTTIRVAISMAPMLHLLHTELCDVDGCAAAVLCRPVLVIRLVCCECGIQGGDGQFRQAIDPFVIGLGWLGFQVFVPFLPHLGNSQTHLGFG